MGAQNQSNLNKLNYCMCHSHSAHPHKHSLGVKLASQMFNFHAETMQLWSAWKCTYTGKKDINWVETLVVYKQI